MNTRTSRRGRLSNLVIGKNCSGYSVVGPSFQAWSNFPFMHSHVGSFMHSVAFFLGVVIIGTLWRLLALHALASSSARLQKFGSVMLFQY